MRLKPDGGDPRLRLRKRGGGAATPKTSRYTRHGEGEAIVVRKFLASDIESIEGIGAVGAVFEQVFFALGKFLAGLVFAEAVASATDPCRLYGENQVLVV